MKVPLSFLKEYIETDLSPEEIAETLTLAGLEVYSIDTPDLSFTGIVVGKVEKAEKEMVGIKLNFTARENDKVFVIESNQ